MNENELVEEISKRAKVTTQEAKSIIQGLSQTTIEELKKGGYVKISGFGSFLLSRRRSHTNINLQTGEPTQLPASTTIRFRPNKKFKAKLNQL